MSQGLVSSWEILLSADVKILHLLGLQVNNQDLINNLFSVVLLEFTVQPPTHWGYFGVKIIL
jgi:hypothetical protein